MEFEKLKKKRFPTDRPTHTGETGSSKGKQKYFDRLKFTIGSQ